MTPFTVCLGFQLGEICTFTQYYDSSEYVWVTRVTKSLPLRPKITRPAQACESRSSLSCPSLDSSPPESRSRPHPSRGCN